MRQLIEFADGLVGKTIARAETSISGSSYVILIGFTDGTVACTGECRREEEFDFDASQVAGNDWFFTCEEVSHAREIVEDRLRRRELAERDLYERLKAKFEGGGQ